MDFQNKLQKYADLIAKAGCNIKEGQELYITASVDCVELARLVTESAYKAGAKKVTTRFGDEKIVRLTYDYCSLDVFEEYPDWLALLNNGMADRGAAILSIISEDPEAMAGVDPRKQIAQVKAAHTACKKFYDGMDFGRNVWCIVGAAAPAWAKKVFPGETEADAMEHLWDAIFHSARVDTPDPVQAWDEHRRSFEKRREFLNAKQFDSLHYTNSIGTDITVGMPESHNWEGGGARTVNDVYFFPNMPTEEIFCSPHKNRVDGTVHSAMPLVYQGTLIDNFSITFKDGYAVDFTAGQGYDVLKEMIGTDEGAHRLGEVALIPRKSPIAEMGILFYNTLYDENASCHFAIGKAFPECIQGGLEMNEEQLAEAGLNHSATHVDFMLGTDDLKIVGIGKDGSETPLFENGNWAF